MKTITTAEKRNTGLDMMALKAVANKFSLINKQIESGKKIDSELSKNFVSLPPLSDNDDPFKDIE
ncbi:MAG: hypothetical protein K0S33_3576 [Bacteroidetes bacterium]|jgi:hypothetical protein|nr:hypothetical protein [Bacteroidota bacterium]